MTTHQLTVHPVPGVGTEDVVVATHGPFEGSVFTGTDDGALHRISPDGAHVEQVGHTGGRPLGIELDPDGRLLVCDAHRGVLRVDPATGATEVLADRVGGTTMKLVDNAAVADDGGVWFSDSSTHFGLEHWKADFVQNTRSGRLLRLDPATGEVQVVLDGLAFANGVALSRAQDFVCVAETAARTIVRRWLTGPRAGLRDYLAMDLPGYPDNLSLGSDGLIWVALASPRDPLVERLQTAPMAVRRLATRIPDRLQPQPRVTLRVRAYDDEARLVHDLEVDPAQLVEQPDGRPAFHMVTGVREHDGRVWLGSLVSSAVAVLEHP